MPMHKIATSATFLMLLLTTFIMENISMHMSKTNNHHISNSTRTSNSTTSRKNETQSASDDTTKMLLDKSEMLNLFVEYDRIPGSNESKQFYTNLDRDKCDDLFKLVKRVPSSERKRILVTGGAGFVGSHLVDSLMLDGQEVIACDNFLTGRKRNVQHWLDHPHFDLLTHDVTDGLKLRVDQIYHLASPASPPHYMSNPLSTIQTNVQGTLNMLELAKQNNATFLLASTSEVYGDPNVHPQVETYWGNVNPVGPRACYDESKRLSETLVTTYQSQFNLPVRIARIFNTYGPRMHPKDGRVVSNLIMQGLKNESMTIYGSGNQTRSFQYITDLVAGLKSLMASEVTSPVNLGNPNETSISSLAASIKSSISECKSGIEHKDLPRDDPQRRRPEISKAKEKLSWAPEVSLEAGLNRTIEYFRQESQS